MNIQKQKIIVIGGFVIILSLLFILFKDNSEEPIAETSLVVSDTVTTSEEDLPDTQEANTASPVVTETSETLESTVAPAPVTTVPTAPTQPSIQTPTKTTPSAPAVSTEDLQKGDIVNEVLAGDSSKRCSWIDESGNEGVAFILYSLLRTEIETKDDGTFVTIYKPTESYFWNTEEKEGSIIPREVDNMILLANYTPFNTIDTYIKTSDRVKCEPKVINESYFVPSAKVTFTDVVK